MPEKTSGGIRNSSSRGDPGKRRCLRLGLLTCLSPSIGAYSLISVRPLVCLGVLNRKAPSGRSARPTSALKPSNRPPQAYPGSAQPVPLETLRGTAGTVGEKIQPPLKDPRSKPRIATEHSAHRHAPSSMCRHQRDVSPRFSRRSLIPRTNTGNRRKRLQQFFDSLFASIHRHL